MFSKFLEYFKDQLYWYFYALKFISSQALFTIDDHYANIWSHELLWLKPFYSLMNFETPEKEYS